MTKKGFGIVILFFLLLCIISFTQSTFAKDFLNVDYFLNNRGLLKTYTSNNFTLASIIFLTTYIFVVSLYIPLATVLALGAGFLFGPLWSTLLINIGSVLGALVTFCGSRYLLRDLIYGRFKNSIDIIDKEIQNNPKSYLLMLRLIPIFPFFIVNLAVGITKVSLFTFIWTTSIGSIPASFLYTYSGSRLGDIKTMKDAVSPSTILVLAILGIFALSPVVATKLKLKSKNSLKSK